jgi:hypothetical protein
LSQPAALAVAADQREGVCPEQDRTEQEASTHGSQARDDNDFALSRLRFAAVHDERFPFGRSPLRTEERPNPGQKMRVGVHLALEGLRRAGHLAQPAAGTAIAHLRPRIERDGTFGARLLAKSAFVPAMAQPLATLGERGRDATLRGWRRNGQESHLP